MEASAGTPTQAPSTPAAAPTGGSPAQNQGAQQPQPSGDRESPGIRPGAGKPDAAATPPAPEPKAAPQAPEHFEVKVNGRVVKMTREEAIAHASMGLAAQERFQEAASMRKQVESVLARLKDPKQAIPALQSLGLPKEAIKAAIEDWYTSEVLEPEQLTPEQLKLRELETWKKQREEQDAAQARKAQEEEAEKAKSAARETLQKDIIEALEQSRLPKTRFMVSRLAYYMQQNHRNGFNAPIPVLIGQVQKELDGSLRAIAQESSAEALIQVLGEQVINKIRQYDLEQLRARRGQGRPAQVDDASTQPRTDGEKTSMADVSDRIRQLQRTGRF